MTDLAVISQLATAAVQVSACNPVPSAAPGERRGIGAELQRGRAVGQPDRRRGEHAAVDDAPVHAPSGSGSAAEWASPWRRRAGARSRRAAPTPSGSPGRWHPAVGDPGVAATEINPQPRSSRNFTRSSSRHEVCDALRRSPRVRSPGRFRRRSAAARQLPPGPVADDCARQQPPCDGRGSHVLPFRMSRNESGYQSEADRKGLVPHSYLNSSLPILLAIRAD